MPTAIKPSSISKARKLRREMTDGEKKLWSELKQFRRWYGLYVRRQAPIGPYVADFVIHEKKLVIEIDGEHHQYLDRIARDAKRDEWLVEKATKSFGLRLAPSGIISMAVSKRFCGRFGWREV